jgi:oligosaccharide repeat unit polymerase
MSFIASIFLLGLSGFSYFKFKYLLSPAVLMPAIWGIILMLHPICQATILPDLYDISPKSLLVFVAGCTFFVLGAFGYVSLRETAFSFHENRAVISSYPADRAPSISIVVRVLLLAIVILVLPLYIQRSFILFLRSGADSLLQGVRNELILGEADLGPVKYMQPLSIVAYAFCEVASLKEPQTKNRLMAMLSLLLAFVYALFSTGRTFFFILMLLYIGLRVVLKKGFLLIRYLWVFPLLFVLFGFYGLVYGKGGNTDQPIAESFRGVAEVTAIYLVTPATAFDLISQPPFEPSFDGHRVFRFFFVVSNALGITEVSKDELKSLQEFVGVPYEGNVFTVFSPYTRDFGFTAAFVFLLLFGWVHTWLFSKAKASQASNFAIYYALMLYPLMMTFFDDQYVSALSLWLQFVILVEGFLLMDRFFFSRFLKKGNSIS